MNGNAELLNFIYQNSQMGVNTLSQLMDIAEMRSSESIFSNGTRSTRTFTGKQALNENGYDEEE